MCPSQPAQMLVTGVCFTSTVEFMTPETAVSKVACQLPPCLTLQEISTLLSKLHWCEAATGRSTWKGPSPSAPYWSNRRVMENRVHRIKSQPEVWTALSETETRVSSRLKTHLLGWYWVCSWDFKAWRSGRLETAICLLGTALMSDFFQPIFGCFNFQERRVNDKHQVNMRSHCGGGSTLRKLASLHLLKASEQSCFNPKKKTHNACLILT